MFLTILIEIIGRFILNLWNYPSFNLTDKIIHVFLIGYPFAFFSIHESIKLIRKKIKSWSLSIILATIINAFFHEVPNIFSWEWFILFPILDLKFYT